MGGQCSGLRQRTGGTRPTFPGACLLRPMARADARLQSGVPSPKLVRRGSLFASVCALAGKEVAPQPLSPRAPRTATICRPPCPALSRSSLACQAFPIRMAQKGTLGCGPAGLCAPTERQGGLPGLPKSKKEAERREGRLGGHGAGRCLMSPGALLSKLPRRACLVARSHRWGQGRGRQEPLSQEQKRAPSGGGGGRRRLQAV